MCMIKLIVFSLVLSQGKLTHNIQRYTFFTVLKCSAICYYAFILNLGFEAHTRYIFAPFLVFSLFTSSTSLCSNFQWIRIMEMNLIYILVCNKSFEYLPYSYILAIYTSDIQKFWFSHWHLLTKPVLFIAK